jgi:adenosine deaminase
LERLICNPLLVGGDESAIERISYELAEDQAREGCAYFEARYSPHFLQSSRGHQSASHDKHAISPQDVIDAVTRGLERGFKDFGVKSNQILCLISGQSERAEEIYQLIKSNRKKGIVAIDIAGSESICEDFHAFEYSVTEAALFSAAKKDGIRRTVHAAETGAASNVVDALNDLHAERIGHGYHVVRDEAIYRDCIEKQVHFECCPHSSIMTGGVSSVMNKGKHPIVQFAEDGANFSINKDDTTVTGTTLDDEYELLTKLGLTEAHFTRANLNAARAAFLPEAEKAQLVNHLLDVYGFNEKNVLFHHA